MAELSYGSHFGYFTAVVVDRNDPLRAGRVKLRVMGVHDDQNNIPDKDLPWSYPSQSISSSSLGHVGQSPTGIQVGSTVVGVWADRDRTIPIWHGTISRSQIEKPKGAQRPQAQANTQLQNDVAYNARGVQKMDVKGETNLGKDFITQIKDSIFGKFEDAKEDKAVKYKKPKYSKLKTIGDQTYKDKDKILNIIKQIDPNNEAGSIKPALDVMRRLKNLTSAGGSMLGSGQFGSIFNSLISKLMSGGGGGNTFTSGGGSPQQFIQKLVNDPKAEIDVGEGTHEDSLPYKQDPSIETWNNDSKNLGLISPPQNNSGSGNKGGGGGSGGSSGGLSSILNMLKSILQQVFQGMGGPKGGLGSFDKEQGVLKAMESAFKQLK